MVQEQSEEAGRVKAGRMACLLLAAASFVLCALLLADYLLSEDRVRLSRANCRMVSATIVNKGRSLEQRGGMQFPVHLVRYAFTFEGRRLEGRGRVSGEWYNWLDRGSEVIIYVDTASPQRNFLKQEYDFCVGRTLRAVYIAALAFAALTTCAIFPAVLRRITLRGLSARGTSKLF
jgi:hypothetical protein